jgi:hypothetical protein
MRTYGDKLREKFSRSISPPGLEELERIRQERYPPISRHAVLRDNGSLWVRCVCSKEFEYLQDQVVCTACGRYFDVDSALDLTS